MLKTVSDQPHIAKNVAYGLPFYGIVWILVRQGQFMDQEFEHGILDLFGNAFWQGCSEMLFGKGLYRVEECLFSILASRRCEFLLRGFSVHVLIFVTYSFLLIMVSWARRWGFQFWQSCLLMACNFINNEIFCAFTGLLSVGECISSKSNGQPLFLLEKNFPWTLDTLIALFTTLKYVTLHLCYSN